MNVVYIGLTGVKQYDLDITDILNFVDKSRAANA